MFKKRTLIKLTFSLLITIIILGITLNFLEPKFYVKFTGKAIENQAVSIGNKEIQIQSPQNMTYFIKDKNQYTLQLNATANFKVKKWQYDLINTDTKEIISKETPFTAQTQIEVSRWNNKLIIRALDEFGEIVEESVEFYVSTSDSYPMIQGIEPTIYLCEGDSLKYPFTVNDPEANKNQGPIEIKIEPLETFYIKPTKIYPSNEEKTTNFTIISKKMTKEDAGGVDQTSKTYQRTINANDGMYSSYNETRIIVIEKNNPPQIQKIGAKTEVIEWKETNTINYKAKAFDIEDGNQDSGNLKFDISFSGEKLFDINSNGLMTLKYEDTHIGVYNITVCVTDTGIDKPHTKISQVCGQTGSDQKSCTNFTLTITKNNNPPTITEQYPKKLRIESEKSTLYFNITTFDPDKSTPDVYWYADDELISYTPGNDLINGNSQIKYSFGCKTGTHSIKAGITDGLLNDTVEWKIKLTPQSGCQEQPECNQEWVCEQWKACQNLQKSADSGILPQEDFQKIQDECVANKWDSENCGFQIRECLDLNECNNTLYEPEKIQKCFFTQNPNCEDGIKNCHTRDCEVLTDCGGPCKPCPTCNDGIQNQGEEDVDCSGPCYIKCTTKEYPIISLKSPLKYVLIILILGLLLIITFKIIRISHIRKQIKTQEESYPW